jgi:Uma2 family endonuclease
MMGTTAAHSEPRIKRPATYQDVLDAPEHMIAEVLDGELFLQPRPAIPHVHTNFELIAILIARLRRDSKNPDKRSSWYLLYEPELHLGSDVVAPDIVGWRPGRNPYDPTIPYITLVPDWVCEIASPSTQRRDRMQKMPMYARTGVEYVWLVDPAQHSVEAFHRPPGIEGETWLRVAGGVDHESVVLPPFDDAPFSLADLWIETRFGPATDPTTTKPAP